MVYSVLFVAIMFNFEGESYTVIDGIYWVISTITTVGYGDIYFTSLPGKVFSVVVMLSGVLYFFGFFVPYAIIPWAEQRFRLVLPTEIKNLRDHFIICGYNRFTKEFCKILEEFGVSYVVVERDQERVGEAMDEGVRCVYSDGSLESFRKNGVEQCNALIIGWENLEDIIDTLLTLRKYGARKYVIYGDHTYTRYLLYAGATKVFLPKSLIASSTARMILQEVQIGRMREILGDIHTIEIVLPKNVPVSEFEARGVRVVAACRMGNLEFNPGKDRILEKGCVALVAGKKDSLEEIIHEGSHIRLR
ncbi:potassium channel family protein [Archaeoglobus neptunius]|uniref:potassium channel family protein n=1 Tax=Archaeoglobus neptunius TaxID=2798580 RepID=UPI00192667CF